MAADEAAREGVLDGYEIEPALGAMEDLGAALSGLRPRGQMSAFGEAEATRAGRPAACHPGAPEIG